MVSFGIQGRGEMALRNFDVVSGCRVSIRCASHVKVSRRPLEKDTYAGKIPTLSPIRPVHQSSFFSVRFRIVMISPFLKPKSPS